MGIGPKFAEKLKAVGIVTAADLLRYFPYRFEDFSKPLPISSLRFGRPTVINAEVVQASNERSPRRRMVITKVLLKDISGSITAIWFNQPYLLRQLKPGSRFLFAGKMVTERNGGKAFQVSTIEREAKIFPVYHESTGLTSKWLRNFIAKVIDTAQLIAETLPKNILSERKLPPLADAIRAIHQPKSAEQLAAGRRRLGIEELLPIMLRSMELRRQLSTAIAPQITIDEPLLKQFVEGLAFKLTDDQRKSAWQIIKDLAKPVPMNRLLQGEVGSGKTVVAAMAALLVSRSGYQSLWLAPTEILANQHYRNVSQLLERFGLSVGLWTAGTKVKLDADLVIGTHALLRENLTFPKLAAVIVDEQHRFGVKQRSRLRAATTNQLIPHFLSMTATPIPRTLFLTIWGDLDLTLIREMPAQRKPVITRLIEPAKRQQTYQFVREQVSQGRQVFVIVPIIGELNGSKAQKLKKTLFAELERKSAIKEYQKLSKEIFPDLKIGLLHGRMSSKQKNKVMQDFDRHKLDILVSTAVVEVGIDVANAAVMMIEGAERFGLAQLHQLRGRVGRAEHQSFCLLMPESDEALEHRRLSAMVKTNSGLELAEYDLHYRGPGELLGTRQHGLPDFQMASLTDSRLIEEAQSIAKQVFEYGLEKLPELNKKLEHFEQVEHLE